MTRRTARRIASCARRSSTAAARMFRKASATPVGLTDPGTGDAERWARLMARAQDGHQDDYQALLEDIAPYLRGVCRRYLGYDDEVEDVLQDILLTVHCIRHTYERSRPFKPWLYTIARRRIADWARRRSRRLRRVDDHAGRAERGVTINAAVLELPHVRLMTDRTNFRSASQDIDASRFLGHAYARRKKRTKRRD